MDLLRASISLGLEVWVCERYRPYNKTRSVTRPWLIRDVKRSHDSEILLPEIRRDMFPWLLTWPRSFGEKIRLQISTYLNYKCFRKGRMGQMGRRRWRNRLRQEKKQISCYHIHFDGIFEAQGDGGKRQSSSLAEIKIFERVKRKKGKKLAIM